MAESFVVPSTTARVTMSAHMTLLRFRSTLQTLDNKAVFCSSVKYIEQPFGLRIRRRQIKIHHMHSFMVTLANNRRQFIT